MALVIVTAGHGAAFAQTATAAADTPVPDGDIVVTAQRREQTLQNTPVAVSAFNTEMLQARGVTSVINIAASTPGLYIGQGTASPNTLQIAMRGALEQNGGTITSESPVAIYIDDVYQSRLSAGNYDLADIERVEVLRGPQGTLYGRNSMTGAIKLVTKQPNGTTWLKTDLSFARFDEVRAKVSMGAPISDTVAFAGSAFYDERFKGWQYNETLDKDVSKFARWGVQGAFGLTNIDNLEAVLTGRYMENRSDGQHFLPINENFGPVAPGDSPFDPAVPFYHTRTPLDANGDNKQYTFSLNLGYDLGSAKIRSITAYQHLWENWALDFGGGYRAAPGQPTTVGFYRDSTGKQHQITQEVQLLGKALDDKLNYIAGVFYFDERANQNNGPTGDIFLTFPTGPSTIRTSSQSIAAYSQVDWEFIPSLTGSVGLRFTHDKKRFDGQTPDGTGTIFQLGYGLKANVWTPKFNLQWKFSEHGQVYGTVSRGYRAGSFNSLNSGDPTGYGVPYRPETAWSYELGTKFDAFDRKFTMNVAAYYERLKDLQTLAYGAVVGSFLFQNAAEAEVAGIEVESTLRPTRWLNLFGNLTYTHDKYLEQDPTSQAALAGADRLPLISRWQYQLGGTVTVPVGEGAIDFSADYNYRSAFFSLVTLAQASRNHSIGRANGTVTYKAPGGHWELYGQGTNIFGSKDYQASAEFVEGLFGYKIPMEPAIWRVGFRYKM